MLFVCEPLHCSSTHLFSSIVFFLSWLISSWIFKQLSHISTLCFIPHTHTKKAMVQKTRISYFTDVCPALMRRCFIRTRSLQRNASISMLLEFVDSLGKWNGSDGASNVLIGLLESNKFTEYLVFFHKHRYNGCVCACQDPLVCKTRPKYYIMKLSIKVDNVCTLFLLWDGF